MSPSKQINCSDFNSTPHQQRNVTFLKVSLVGSFNSAVGIVDKAAQLFECLQVRSATVDSAKGYQNATSVL